MPKPAEGSQRAGRDALPMDTRLNRRAMIAGTLGAGALLAPSLRSARPGPGGRGIATGRATAAPATLTEAIGPAPAETAGAPQLGGLHGATLDLSTFRNGTTWPEAISQWQTYTGTLIRTTKLYHGPGQFPVALQGPGVAAVKAGIKAMLCFKPRFSPVSAADLTALEDSLRMYKNAGMLADVTLWQEPQIWRNHLSDLQYKDMVSYYGPTVRKYYDLVYDAAGHSAAYGWTAYYPGPSEVDVIAVDYYGHHYVAGERLDEIANLADAATPAMPFGIWEMGNTTPRGSNPDQAQMEAYFGYVESFMADRIAAGKPNAEIAWYNGPSPNAIKSSSDFRAGLWKQLVEKTFGGANG